MDNILGEQVDGISYTDAKTINRNKSIKDMAEFVQESLDYVNVSCLGGFLRNDSLNITLNGNQGLIFISYEEDGNTRSQLSLRDISGPFETATNLAQGIVKIDDTDLAANISIVAVRLLELMKLGADIHMLETVFGTRFIDLRK